MPADNFDLTAFAPLSPPWNLAQLDANMRGLSDGITNRAVSVTDPAFGAVGDASTDCTAAIVAAIAYVVALGGGIVVFPPGIYMTNPLIVPSNVVFMGPGLGATLRCNSAGSTFILYSNVSSVAWYNIRVDANGLCANTEKYVAPLGLSCALVRHFNFTGMGATDWTVNIADAGGGSQNDVSHISYYASDLRSSNPTGGQWINSAANGLVHHFFGGRMGGPGASPYNVKLETGQLTCYGTELAGATDADVWLTGGQWQQYQGGTESARYIHTDVADTGGYDQSAHQVRGVQMRTSGADSIYHEATRSLIVEGCDAAGDIRIGTNARLIGSGVSFPGGGVQWVTEGNGQLHVVAASLSSGITLRGIVNGDLVDVHAQNGTPAHDSLIRFFNDVGNDTWAWTLGTAAHDMAFRNLTGAYDAMYFLRGTTAASISVGGPNRGPGATIGFPQMPIVTGPPVSSPSVITGFCPFAFEAGADTLWVYNGSAWKSVVLT